jgi:polyisoprenoid-binding protein YceI
MSATASSTLIPTGVWAVDPAHSRVGFAVKHMGIATVRGTFDRFDGALRIDGGLSRTEITASIDAASVNTNEEQRDAHLRSPDFFDADTFPEVRFESSSVRQLDEETLTVAGNLTMHGITQPVELEAEITGFETDPWGNERVGIELTGQLSRGAFGMKFNQALGGGNVLVSDKVKLSIDISAIRTELG